MGRKICQNCKEAVAATEAEQAVIERIISEMPEKARKDIGKDLKFYRGKGCSDCNNTGYKGRIGIFEVLAITENIKKLVLEKVAGSTIQKQATDENMLTMIQDGILKATQGQTTLEEVWRVTKE